MKKAGGFFLALALLAGAIFYGFYKVKTNVTYTLDFGSVADAFVLLVVGALVEYAYLKQSSEKSADNDLLLTIVAEAKTAFSKLADLEQNCESGKVLTAQQRRSLTCAEREFSNAVHSVEKALDYCTIDLRSLAFDKLKDARVSLKDCLTDTPFPGPYDPASLVRIRTAFKAMRDELTRIAFAINHR